MTIVDVSVSTMSLPTFSSIYAIMTITCNVAIPAGSILFLTFPFEFDNFNNNPINAILKDSANAIIATGDMAVIDRTLEIPIPALISTNSKFSIEFPSLPTPKSGCSVPMSDTRGYVTPANKLTIFAPTFSAGNSAPIMTFVPDNRYLSFNGDNTIVITAGTFSLPIQIASSDSQVFLSNIQVSISAAGFTFEPEQVFLQLGDESG